MCWGRTSRTEGRWFRPVLPRVKVLKLLPRPTWCRCTARPMGCRQRKRYADHGVWVWRPSPARARTPWAGLVAVHRDRVHGHGSLAQPRSSTPRVRETSTQHTTRLDTSKRVAAMAPVSSAAAPLAKRRCRRAGTARPARVHSADHLRSEWRSLRRSSRSPA